MADHVIDRVDLPEGAGSVLLDDWMSKEVKDGSNLMRVDPEAGVLWKATPPMTGMQDCFTAIQWDGRTLSANTWSCHRVRIDLKNGSVTVLAFTK